MSRTPSICTAPEPGSELAARSSLALRLAAGIDFEAPADAAQWLYDYGVEPLAPSDVRGRDTLRPLLSTDDASRLGDAYASSVANSWHAFELRDLGDGPAPVYKTYVSPGRLALEGALRETVALLAEEPVDAFKLVRNHRAALRPDKLIVYHRAPDARERWSRRLLARLARCPAQGVPFTQQVGDTPLVSFAEDPKPQGGDTNPESWRSWLVTCLGTALYVARAAGADPDVACASALHAARLEGVDPSLWRRRAGFGRTGVAS